MNYEGAELAARRESLNLTLDDVARTTRIPRKYLEALESGEEDVIPVGPYRSAYLRAYREQLGLDPDGVIAPATRRRSALVPLRLLQTVAFVCVLVAVIVGLREVWLLAKVEDARQAATADIPDQDLRVVANYTAFVRVTVDGDEAFARQLPGGASQLFVARDRIEVELVAAESARLWWNGEPISPQGRQDAPRKLIFVDDVGRAAE